MRFSPDGVLVASASADGTAALAAAASPASSGGGGSGGTAGGTVLAQLRGHTGGLSDCAWSVDGDWLATASDDAAVKLWDVATVRARARAPFTHLRARVWQSRAAAAAAQRNLHRPHSPAAHSQSKEVSSYIGHLASVFCTEFSPRGNLLASGSTDESVRVRSASLARVRKEATLEAHSRRRHRQPFPTAGTPVGHSRGCERAHHPRAQRAHYLAEL